jgi:DNA-binding NtrC family response regulator
MEFIFRTLVEMKMDLEDLRAEFERYRGRHHELVPGLPLEDLPSAPIEITVRDEEQVPFEEEVAADAGDVPTIRVTPDMTMDEVEREAIRIALEEMDGNRRKAAERLGIGERTLYRKLRQYDLDA